MASKLTIDFDTLQDVIDKYVEALQDLNTAVQQIDTAMHTLEATRWKTEASVAYFAQYTDDWRTSVDDHITALSTLLNSLYVAQAEYGKLYDQIGTMHSTFEI